MRRDRSLCGGLTKPPQATDNPHRLMIGVTVMLDLSVMQATPSLGERGGVAGAFSRFAVVPLETLRLSSLRVIATVPDTRRLVDYHS